MATCARQPPGVATPGPRRTNAIAVEFLRIEGATTPFRADPAPRTVIAADAQGHRMRPDWALAP
jgi:hypothetical protein